MRSAPLWHSSCHTEANRFYKEDRLKLVETLTARTRTFILAGGRGERLFPLTIDRPKPAVPFGGFYRIIDFTLSNCVNSGLNKIRILTQYKHEHLHEYVRQAWRDRAGNHPACIAAVGGKQYRGTADAVFQNLAAEEQMPDFVLVLSGDHVYQMDYRDMLMQHAATEADLTIGTVEQPLKSASRYGVVEVDQDFRVTGFQEKPANPRPVPSNPAMALVSMGIYVFKTDCLLRLMDSGAQDFGKDVIPSLINSSKVHAYDFRDPVAHTPRYWRDIGTLDSYYESHMDLLSPASRHNSVVAPGVEIGHGAQVERSVLMRGVRVGRGARIRKAIIEENVYIPGGTEIGYDAEKDRKKYFVTETGITVVKAANDAKLAFASLA
jgi:glucose-1-phosphate adenylyltransferase